MKQAHSFLLGGITATLIIACSGSSNNGAEAGQSIKLDSAQVSQIVAAIKKPKWAYNVATVIQLKKAGEDGWEMVGFDKDPKGVTKYVMKRRID